MKHMLLLVGLSVGLGAQMGCGGTHPETAPGDTTTAANSQPSPLHIEGVGSATQESVLHDPESDVYLVSNINGSPLGVDGNGFISRVDVAGLPKGGLDGIVETTDGRLLVTSWAGESVYSVDPAGSIATFADGLPAR